MSNQQAQPAQQQQVQTAPAQPVQQQIQTAPAQPVQQQVQTAPAQPVQQQVQPAPAQPAQQQVQPIQGGFNVGNMPIEDANAVLQNVQGYESIIVQQQAQINALINANNSLNQQVTQMVQNGAQFYQPQQPQQTIFQPQQPQQPTYNLLTGQLNIPTPLQNNEDYSLEALAKEIGKRDDLPPKK